MASYAMWMVASIPIAVLSLGFSFPDRGTRRAHRSALQPYALLVHGPRHRLCVAAPSPRVMVYVDPATDQWAAAQRRLRARHVHPAVKETGAGTGVRSFRIELVNVILPVLGPPTAKLFTKDFGCSAPLKFTGRGINTPESANPVRSLALRSGCDAGCRNLRCPR